MRNFQEILERIAKENGTTPDNVLQEMQRAIDEAFDHHDADAQPIWDMMTFKTDFLPNYESEAPLQFTGGLCVTVLCYSLDPASSQPDK